MAAVIVTEMYCRQVSKGKKLRLDQYIVTGSWKEMGLYRKEMGVHFHYDILIMTRSRVPLHHLTSCLYHPWPLLLKVVNNSSKYLENCLSIGRQIDIINLCFLCPIWCKCSKTSRLFITKGNEIEYKVFLQSLSFIWNCLPRLSPG